MRAIVGVLFAVAVAACDAPAPDPVTAESGADVTGATLGEAMNGAAVTVEVGGRFTLALQSIPTAGYVWQVIEQPEGLALVGEATRPTDPARQNQPGFTGGNHWMDFTFEAQAPFTGALRLVEARPWELENGQPPDDEFTLVVTAAD